MLNVSFGKRLFALFRLDSALYPQKLILIPFLIKIKREKNTAMLDDESHPKTNPTTAYFQYCEAEWHFWMA
jgi:hypothetical protein